jgi:hypothetical protein
MQTGKEKHSRQQLIMQLLGFYKGKVDGIWGPATMDAKRRWEMSTKFEPAIPNNGLPLGDRGPYPKGIRIGSDGLLTCAELELHLSKGLKPEAAT